MPFSDFHGNTEVHRLRDMLARKRFPHAVILSGARGSGKYTLALMLAQALNCLRPSHLPACIWSPFCILFWRFWRPVWPLITTAVEWCILWPGCWLACLCYKANSRSCHDRLIRGGAAGYHPGARTEVVCRTCRDLICNWLVDTCGFDLHMAGFAWRLTQFPVGRIFARPVKQGLAHLAAGSAVSWNCRRLLFEGLCRTGNRGNIVDRLRLSAWRRGEPIIATRIMAATIYHLGNPYGRSDISRRSGCRGSLWRLSLRAAAGRDRMAQRAPLLW